MYHLNTHENLLYFVIDCWKICSRPLNSLKNSVPNELLHNPALTAAMIRGRLLNFSKNKPSRIPKYQKMF